MSVKQTISRRLPTGLRRRLGSLRRRLRAMRVRTHAQKTRLLEDPSLNREDRELLQQVDDRVFYNDGMYVGNGEHYFKAGLSAIHCIDEAVQRAGLREIKTILDLPCGGGRVLRFLVRRFPQAKVTACDLQPDMVAFCAATFGTSAANSATDFEKISLRETYDLIWCGSLVTHLNEPGISALVKFFARQLNAGGLLVFSTNGDRAAQRMVAAEFDYAIPNEKLPPMVERYRAEGFGFVSYPGEDDYGVVSNEGRYGISLIERSRVRALAEPLGLTEVYFAAHGWDDHQDVYGFVK